MTLETQQLAEFVVDFQLEDLPENIVKQLCCFVTDNFAAGFIGSQQPWYDIVADVEFRLGGVGESHVFGRTACLDVSRASLVNGVAIGAFETENARAGAHPSGTVFPAVLALGEAIKASGKDLIRAMAVGYEVDARVAAAQTNLAERVRGFHNPGICGVFGSASACAVLLDLSLEQTLAALGIAGSHAAGLIEFVWTGSMTKRLHLGRASQMGLEAALLARGGFSGPPTIFEGEYGFLQAYSPEPNLSILVESLGSRWLLEGIRVKPYPVHGSSEAFVPVLDDWRRRANASSHIDRVAVKASAATTERRHLDPAPTSVLGAQYSVPFTIALVLTRGIDGLIELNQSSIDDESIRRLAGRITVEHDMRFDELAASTARGEVMIESGGSSDLLEIPAVVPYSLDEMDTICRNKLTRYARKVVTNEHVLQIQDTIDALSQLSDVGDLARLLEY